LGGSASEIGRRVIAMLETDNLFAGSIPENYDRYMVPLIFEPFTADLAQRAASLSPSAVLETAAGTGVVTRALASKLPPGASYIVTDLNQPMLDYAASRQAPDSRIKWRQADALALPFENAAFDRPDMVRSLWRFGIECACGIGLQLAGGHPQ
jgi:ubiquinone/menaquinone biosynthesis C-methylase UbiE